MKKFSTEVVVLGAGAAGLAAADELARAGRPFQLFEARTRCGGRMWTLPSSGLPVELGPEFVHGVASATLPLCRRFFLETVEVPDGWWTATPQGLRPADEYTPLDAAWEAIAAWVEKNPLPADLPLGEFLRLHPVPSVDRAKLDAFIEGFHAADPALMSIRALDRLAKLAETSQESRSFRVVAGYQALVDALAASLPPQSLRLGHAVRSVHWDESSVRVTTATEEWTARSAIVTLPLPLLQQETVQFVPPLTAKAPALATLRAGVVEKLVCEFRSPFWTTESRVVPGSEARRTKMTFLQDPSLVFATWWTTAPLPSPRLVAWTAGKRAEPLRDLDAKARETQALDDLARLTGVPRARVSELFVRSWSHDWSADPESRGAYSWALTGGSESHRALAQPLGALLFAGEATEYSGDNATVNGAFESGKRAAAEALARGGR